MANFDHVSIHIDGVGMGLFLMCSHFLAHLKDIIQEYYFMNDFFS